MDWRRFTVIAFVIAILFGVVVLVGQEISPIVIITSMLATTIAVATPLTLGALSGMFCERAGVVNIGIEGMMLGAAFFGWLGIHLHEFRLRFRDSAEHYSWGNRCHPERRIICSPACRALYHVQSGSDHRRHSHQHSGHRNHGLPEPAVILRKRKHFRWEGAARPGVLPRIHIPITELFPPGAGEHRHLLRGEHQIFDQAPVTISAIVLVILTHYVLFYTRWGLRTRAVGEHPRAADTVGINVISCAI